MWMLPSSFAPGISGVEGTGERVEGWTWVTNGDLLCLDSTGYAGLALKRGRPKWQRLFVNAFKCYCSTEQIQKKDSYGF